MKERAIHDVYTVTSKGQLNIEHVRLLSLLYLPLMQSESFALYMCLFSEVDRISCLSITSSHERLTLLTGLSISKLDQGLRELEALGLIRTYVSYQDTLTEYLYELYFPLNAQRFFEHPLFNTMLYHTLEEVEYEKTRYYFKVPKIDDRYEEVTASFNDVFHVSLHETKPLQVQEDYRVNLLRDVQLNYDLEPFYQHLKDYQIPKRSITKEVERLICQLGTVYQVTAMEMLGIVKESLHHQQVDESLLKKKVRQYYDLETPVSFKEVYHTQPKRYLSQTQDEKLKKHIEYLEKVSPYQLLKDRQGGKEPTAHDLAIVESLMTRLHLEPGVINVLIEFVLSQNDERFTRAYCETIAGSWVRKNIQTVKAAMDESIQYLKQRDHQKDEVEPEWYTSQKHTAMFNKETTQQEDEDFEALLQSLKEGGQHV